MDQTKQLSVHDCGMLTLADFLKEYLLSLIFVSMFRQKICVATRGISERCMKKLRCEVA
jgi:hypothetical protein